jgi:ABC-type multidrug transport system ATPase subunit
MPIALQPQDNAHLIGVLTVRESIAYSLKLKRPRMSAADRNAQVDKVINHLGLEICEDSQVRAHTRSSRTCPSLAVLSSCPQLVL